MSFFLPFVARKTDKDKHKSTVLILAAILLVVHTASTDPEW